MTQPIDLDSISIASPCSASWDAMEGDAQKRFCGQCQLNVFNLSAMTHDEATNLLSGAEGRICTRFYRREDGTVMTTDCPVGVRAAVRQKVRKARARVAALIGALWAGSLSACWGGRAADGERGAPAPETQLPHAPASEQPDPGSPPIEVLQGDLLVEPVEMGIAAPKMGKVMANPIQGRVAAPSAGADHGAGKEDGTAPGSGLREK